MHLQQDALLADAIRGYDVNTFFAVLHEPVDGRCHVLYSLVLPFHHPQMCRGANVQKVPSTLAASCMPESRKVLC